MEDYVVNNAMKASKMTCAFSDDSSNTILNILDDISLVIVRNGVDDLTDVINFIEEHRTQNKEYIGGISYFKDDSGNSFSKTPAIAVPNPEGGILLACTIEPGSWNKVVIHECGHLFKNLSHPNGDNARPHEHNSQFCVMHQGENHDVDSSWGKMLFWHEAPAYFCGKCIEKLRED